MQANNYTNSTNGRYRVIETTIAPAGMDYFRSRPFILTDQAGRISIVVLSRTDSGIIAFYTNLGSLILLDSVSIITQNNHIGIKVHVAPTSSCLMAVDSPRGDLVSVSNPLQS